MSLEEVVILWTKGNKEVLSLNTSIIVDRLSDKSLMKI